VRLSAGSTFDRIHANAFEHNRSAFKCSIALLDLTKACARTQKRVRRAQVRDNKEKAQVCSIARTAFDRTIKA
jgi:hypothetical protein